MVRGAWVERKVLLGCFAEGPLIFLYGGKRAFVPLTNFDTLGYNKLSGGIGAGQKNTHLLYKEDDT